MESLCWVHPLRSQKVPARDAARTRHDRIFGRHRMGMDD